MDYLFRGGEGLGAGRSISACHYGGDLFFQAGSSVEALSGDDFSDCRDFSPGSRVGYLLDNLLPGDRPASAGSPHRIPGCEMCNGDCAWNCVCVCDSKQMVPGIKTIDIEIPAIAFKDDL